MTMFIKKATFPLNFPETVFEDYAYATSREHKIQALEIKQKIAQALDEAHRKRMHDL